MSNDSSTATGDQPSLRDVGPGAYISGVYAVQNPQVGSTRQGKPYLKCVLRDATGDVPARKWTFESADLAPITAAGFVRISGHTQTFNGQIQLILDGVEPAQVTESEMIRLMPATKFDVDEMFADVTTMLQSLEHPAMRALADAYLGDEELMRRFRVAPAAVSNHHAWIGGLLEHTRQLMRTADAILPFYPDLNRDIVLLGLFLHDLGKTTELTWERGFAYTVEGNLVGHLVSGAIWLQVKAAIAGRTGPRLPTAALKVLQHIVVSHHGRLEYGAAKVPSTPEAIFVSEMDNMDAKVTTALTAADRERVDPAAEGPAAFTDNNWALGTRVYRPDPLAADVPE
ncbi:MAG: 3'-5' exoribonuclease YhaM family protein [Phycisphaerales bacterium]